MTASSPANLRRADDAIRRIALGYPGATEAFPWGHSAFKIGGKVFLFLSLEGQTLSLSAKLPRTGRSALALPFASSTGYGLGKSGWVSATFGATDSVPLDAIADWVDESYRAIAPKKFIAQLEAMPSSTPSTPKSNAMAKSQSKAPASKAVRKTRVGRGTTKSKSEGVFSEDERAAMRERAAELKAERSRKGGGDEDAVLEKIAAMSQPDRGMAERLHAIIKAKAPELMPKTWYGMPAYARDGNVVCFFQSGQKFKARYCTLGFSDRAKLDDGNMWPTTYALQKMNAAEEARIVSLLKTALG